MICIEINCNKNGSFIVDDYIENVNIMDLHCYYPFMPSGSSYHNSLDRCIYNRRSVWLVFFLLFSCFIEGPVLNANSVAPDQSSPSVASALGLYCLPMSLLWNAKHIWVNGIYQLIKYVLLLSCFYTAYMYPNVLSSNVLSYRTFHHFLHVIQWNVLA